MELESCLRLPEDADDADEDLEEPQAEPLVDTRWWLPRREGLFAGLQG